MAKRPASCFLCSRVPLCSLCTHIHAKDVICRLIRKGYTGAYSIEHHSGELEVERTHWQLASLREIMAEIPLEGVDTKEKAYMTQLYAGERRH